MRRKCQYIVEPYARTADLVWADGYCLLITGGMMSPEKAVIERLDGTMVSRDISDVRFTDELVAEVC